MGDRAAGSSPPSPAFNVKTFLDTAGVARRIVRFPAEEVIYAQGDKATSVWYVQTGRVKMSIVSSSGKEAVVAILAPGDFFGEGCLAGQLRRIGTATALEETTALRIGKQTMIKTLHAEPEMSDRFIAHVLARNIRIEEDLVDQLFNSSEKRLARTLLLLARYGTDAGPPHLLPDLSQETLAEIVGTTRSRVNIFLNKFRKLGFIEYTGRGRTLKINNGLLSVVLHD
jgi:CRP/FNR family transcriptional regulator, cyclic AMP receptor protein